MRRREVRCILLFFLVWFVGWVIGVDVGVDMGLVLSMRYGVWNMVYDVQNAVEVQVCILGLKKKSFNLFIKEEKRDTLFNSSTHSFTIYGRGNVKHLYKQLFWNVCTPGCE